jgi:hypothetical protein
MNDYIRRLEQQNEELLTNVNKLEKQIVLAKQRVYQIWGRFEKIDIEDMFSVRFPISTNHIMVDVLYTREEALWELHKNWSRFSKYEKIKRKYEIVVYKKF